MVPCARAMWGCGGAEVALGRVPQTHWPALCWLTKRTPHLLLEGTGTPWWSRAALHFAASSCPFLAYELPQGAGRVGEVGGEEESPSRALYGLRLVTFPQIRRALRMWTHPPLSWQVPPASNKILRQIIYWTYRHPHPSSVAWTT